MKNIHIVPTDKETRLHDTFGNLRLERGFEPSPCNKNIYITSDEEIKEGDWCVDDIGDVFKIEGLEYFKKFCKKIILSTDQDLIKDGVQAIDDEFLEWFVKNPSCEFVNIVPFDGYNAIKGSYFGYEIIIPKEEPKQHVELINDNIEEFDKSIELFKQETLEEAAERHVNTNVAKNVAKLMYKEHFINGAKWQQERSYSEEEVLQILASYADWSINDIRGWFKQFKKK